MTTILLVEDNRTDAELITEAFSEACEYPHRILVSTDGEDALRTLRTMAERPQLILLDLNLPKMSGFEVLQELRQDVDKALNILPVIIYTNSRSSQDVSRAYALGANAFVRKPIGFPAIVRVVKQLGRFWLKTAVLPGTNLDQQTPSIPPDSPAPPSSEQ